MKNPIRIYTVEVWDRDIYEARPFILRTFRRKSDAVSFAEAVLDRYRKKDEPSCVKKLILYAPRKWRESDTNHIPSAADFAHKQMIAGTMHSSEELALIYTELI